jgi:hypothetical protein
MELLNYREKFHNNLNVVYNPDLRFLSATKHFTRIKYFQNNVCRHLYTSLTEILRIWIGWLKNSYIP